MTIAFDLGRKATKQTKSCILTYFVGLTSQFSDNILLVPYKIGTCTRAFDVHTEKRSLNASIRQILK